MTDIKPSNFFSPDPTAKVSSSGTSQLTYTFNDGTGWTEVADDNIKHNKSDVTLINASSIQYTHGVMSPSGSYSIVTQALRNNQTTFEIRGQYAIGTDLSFWLTDATGAKQAVEQALDERNSG